MTGIGSYSLATIQDCAAHVAMCGAMRPLFSTQTSSTKASVSRVIAVLRSTDALQIPLDAVPGLGRPTRTSKADGDPAVVGGVPGVPVATSEVALAADHELLAAKHLPRVELRRPNVRSRGGIVVDPEV